MSMRTETVKFPDQYCVFDLETTGLDVKTAYILEIGAFRVTRVDGVLQEEKKSWLLNWGIPVSEEIKGITGISTELCESEGIAPAIALREFMEFSGLSSFAMPLVGHNIYRYDIPVLFNNLKHVFPGELERLGAVENFAVEFAIDTAAIYKASKLNLERLWSEAAYEYGCRVLDQRVAGLKYNLEVVSDELGIDTKDVMLHRADGDVFLTNEIYKKLCLS